MIGRQLRSIFTVDFHSVSSIIFLAFQFFDTRVSKNLNFRPVCMCLDIGFSNVCRKIQANIFRPLILCSRFHVFGFSQRKNANKFLHFLGLAEASKRVCVAAMLRNFKCEILLHRQIWRGFCRIPDFCVRPYHKYKMEFRLIFFQTFVSLWCS